MKLTVSRGIFFCFACVLIVLVYWPGTTGSFIFDDFHSIVLNEGLRIEQLNYASIKQLLLAGDPGVLGRPISMLTFGLNYFWVGDIQASAFKIVNIACHLVTFIGVYLFSNSLLKIYGQRNFIDQNRIFELSLLIALLWAIVPLQVSSVLYVVQRMTILSAGFSFYALWCYIGWRKEGMPKVIHLIGFVIFSLLAFLSKENAILIAGFVLLIEIFVFEKEVANRKWAVYQNLVFITAVISAILLVIYLHFYEHWYADDYLARDFTQYERILTQIRMLVIYVKWIIVPDITQLGFYHDDTLISTSWLSPASTVLSAMLLTLLVVTFFLFRRRWPLGIFGVFWYLMGHSLESSFIPLEMVFEHRNYLPSFGIFFILVCGLYKLIKENNFRVFIYLIWIIFLSFTTALRSAEWGDKYTQFLAATERHPQSARAQWEMARWYFIEYQQGLAVGFKDEEFYKKAIHYADQSKLADSGSTIALFGVINFQCKIGIDISSQRVDELEKRLQLPYRIENHREYMRLASCIENHSDKQSLMHVVNRLFLMSINNKGINNKQRSELEYIYALLLQNVGEKNKAYKFFVKSLETREADYTYIRLIKLSLEIKLKEKSKFYLESYKAMLGTGYIDDSNYKTLEYLVQHCCIKSEIIKSGKNNE